MDKSLLLNWINKIHDQNTKSRQRSAVVISGDFEYCSQVVNCFLDSLPYKSVIRVSSKLQQSISTKKARTLLGKEYDALVFDANEELDIDAFGAVSGTVKASGILFLLVPDKDNSESYFFRSRFFNRIWLHINEYCNVYVVHKSNELAEIQPRAPFVESLDKPELPFRTQDQKLAVKTIVDGVLEKEKLLIVLSSDRGRGKSSALGLAAAQLLQASRIKIIVSAPRKTSSDPVFYHANKIFPELKQSKDCCLQFMAPDMLIDTQPSADVVFVDEASAIPLPMLEKILDLFPKIVFASTIYGYEGTGRGFALKFNRKLDAKNSDWIKCEMETPIRWIKHDPIEKWVDSMLCLNAELDDVDELKDLDINECEINCINRDELLNDEARLKSLFALLVYAHYRTQPSDLAYMLDNDSIRIYTLEKNTKILAAILISEEGGFDKNLSSEVYKGERRPQGHLLAQTLSFHAGVEFAAMLRYSRVMRIAVHPQLQRRGLGSHLLEQVVIREQSRAIDVIGSSFGSTVELMHFWNRLGFETVRMGFTRDHASGTHSAVVLKALSNAGEDVFIESRSKYRSYIKDWLSAPLSDMTEEMKQYVEKEYIDNGPELMAYEWRDINSFVKTHRGYEACMSALKKLIIKFDKLLSSLDEQDQIIIRAKITDLKSWPETVKQAGVTGKAQALGSLKKSVKHLLVRIKECEDL